MHNLIGSTLKRAPSQVYDIATLLIYPLCGHLWWHRIHSGWWKLISRRMLWKPLTRWETIIHSGLTVCSPQATPSFFSVALILVSERTSGWSQQLDSSDFVCSLTLYVFWVEPGNKANGLYYKSSALVATFVMIDIRKCEVSQFTLAHHLWWIQTNNTETSCLWISLQRLSIYTHKGS